MNTDLKIEKSRLLNQAKFTSTLLNVDYEDAETFVWLINNSYKSLLEEVGV